MLFKKKVDAVDSLLIEKQEQVFYINNINRGDTVFDVGANIGELTLLFSRFTDVNGKVHSFEPTPSTFDKLALIVKTSAKTNVKLNNLAVSGETGFINFNIYDEQYSVLNSMAKRPLSDYGVHINSPKEIEIPTISIDDYCKANFINQIDLLKIDVEGAEINVLKGAEKMFAEKRIKICVFEFGQTIFDMGYSIEDFKSFFRKHNYKVQNVYKEQNIYPVDSKTKWGCFSVLYAKPK